MKPENKASPKKNTAKAAAGPAARKNNTRAPAKSAKVLPVAKAKKVAAKRTRAAAEPDGDKPRAAKSTTSKAASLPRSKKKALKIPAFLLEGDRAAAHPVSGPGQRYALGPTPPTEQFAEPELPEAYGTERLFLAARDPHWIYAHWDLTREQLRRYNGISRDGHLVLRIFKGELAGSPLTEIHVHPESRNWFANVDEGGAKYMAEIGYYDSRGNWVRISTSDATLTPPERMSEDVSVRFATIPPDVPYEDLLRIIRTAAREHVPLAEALLQLRAEGFKNLPAEDQIFSRKWTPEQQRALAQVVTMDEVRRVWIGSLEITELVRRQLMEEVSSAAAAQFGLPTSPGGAFSISSPFGGIERRKGFWFNVNAELIIYGATEPDATVTIGDREIRLRPDGTFSFRFSLPDGRYELPAVAISADGEDSRAAELSFSRRTDYRGDVGAHPQDSRLKPPLVESVA